MPHPVFKGSNVAVITGAASGIGLAIARLCASHGMKLLLTDINATQLAEAALSIGSCAETAEMDVGDRGGWRRIKEKIDTSFGGRVDLLVLNAGVAAKTQWEDVDSFRKVRLLTLLCFALPVVCGTDQWVWTGSRYECVWHSQWRCRVPPRHEGERQR